MIHIRFRRTIYLGNQTGQYWRAWRDFHDFEVCTILFSQPFYLGPDTQGNLMRLMHTHILGQQIDADFTQMSATTQIILAHHTVKIHR